MANFSHYRAHTGSNPDKLFKSTVFEGGGLLLGLNCLDPGQTQQVHTHGDQDKFYYVVEGQGEFVVGDETRLVGVGHVVSAPAGASHGVSNKGSVRLVLLVGMAPSASTVDSSPSPARKRSMPTKRVRKAVKRAARKVKKTVKRARKAAGRAKKKATKTAKRTKQAVGRAKKKAATTAQRAKKAAKRARKAVKRGTKKMKKVAKRAKKAIGTAKRRARKTATRARKAVKRAKRP
ncbi:MAG: cupin domain-containing protein [Gemmatimonadetes bacterium]|nr:cupin domain-containing protein [Gemmatimonadota bacterium]